MPPTSFSCLIALASTSKSLLNSNEDERHPGIYPDFFMCFCVSASKQ